MGKDLFELEEQLGCRLNNLDNLNSDKNNIYDKEDAEQLASWERFFDYTAKNSKPMNFEKANSILIALEKGAIISYNP